MDLYKVELARSVMVPYQRFAEFYVLSKDLLVALSLVAGLHPQEKIVGVALIGRSDNILIEGQK